MLNGGLIRAWKSMAYRRIGILHFDGESLTESDDDDHASEEFLEVLRIDQLQGIFYLYSLLLVISMLLFMIQHLHSRQKATMSYVEAIDWAPSYSNHEIRHSIITALFS